MRPFLVLCLVFLLSAPSAWGQEETWSVEARVAVQADGSALYTWTITGLTNTNLELPRPDGATLFDARDADGRALTVQNVTLANGDPGVRVSIRARPATIRFDLAPALEGAFRIYPAQVAANPTSPVTVSLTLPEGWGLSGYRENDNADPDATGTFRLTGPSYVQYLVADAARPDPGPDARVVGDPVLREGFANLTQEGGTWALVTTYDTDVFGRDWEIYVPEGGRVLRAHTPFGRLDTTPTAIGVKVHTPYPVDFHLGARPFTVEMELPTPAPHGGAFRLTNLSVRAAEGDAVAVLVRADGLEVAGARISEGTREVSPLRFEASGPMSAGVAFLPPAAAGHVQLREGIFVVDAPSRLEAAARATAANASALLPRVASFAHDAADARPFLVAYSENESIFHWEAGFYSNGLNTISIRASTLANATDGRPHLEPVGVLLHEATHGLLDRRLPDAPHNMSFLHEGLSRLAETRTEAYFPTYPEIISCSNTTTESRCNRHSARPDAESLHERFRAQRAFDAGWSATEVGDAERGDLYDHSGYVLHAYTLRAPSGALPNALAHIARTTFTGDDAADARAVVDILLANAPGTSEGALLQPGREASALPIDEFRFCLGTLAAPGYPWETERTRAPPGGCPASGYGAGDATLPPPPPPEASVEGTPSPTPVVTRVLPKPPTTSTPAEEIPPPPLGERETGGAVVEPSDAPVVSSPIEIPAAGASLILALAGVAALTRRRR